ncbi:MAG: fumarylacetoacetate hydrolase family protein [Fuerstiella sp.]|nr:fumarylacetoacetate hydrolase family protein [Fuerstiella sp.]
MSRAVFVAAMLIGCLSLSVVFAAEPTRYLRFQKGETIAYGRLEGDLVRQLDGDLFGEWSRTDITHSLKDIQILIPCQPTQVFALAGNYRSHLSDGPIPEKFRIPQPFTKNVSCLVAHGEAIVIPPDASVVHYEAEMAIVIGKKCSKVSAEDALDYVLGVTAGNDVSERVWQNDKEVKDVQWWRAKGADTFGPVGPYILSGVDYSQLRLRLVLNGETRQDEKTDHLIHNVPDTVSFMSQYVTLQPGDLIFTGTPGTTKIIVPGDTVEVHLDDMVLSNPVK